MKTKVFHLFLLFLLCIRCTDHFQEKVILLNKEIEKTPILSTKFDSLVQKINQIPPYERVECVLLISYRNEKADGMLKQEKLLQEVLSIAPKKTRKKILLRLVAIYNTQDRLDFIKSSTEGIQYIEELEKNYSLTQEEKWDLNKSKAAFLNQQGKQNEYLPIWFKLLKEHRTANNFSLIIEDLYAIASHLEKLGDNNRATSLYKEAYQLSIDQKNSEYSGKCLLQLTNVLLEKKQYNEIIKYYKEIKESNISFQPTMNNILIDCYLGIGKPDSARIILTPRLSTENHNKILLNQKMAETYILEEKEDSASNYLDKANKALHSKSKYYRKKNANASLPINFLHTYTMYAELLQKKGKTQSAKEAYQFVEPLMYTQIQSLNWSEKQINAITSYSTFCRTTKQYEKALELLTHRDSLQHVYNVRKEEQDKNNLIHRFEVGELTHKIEMQDAELKHSKTLNYILILVGIVVAIFITMIILLIRNHRKQNKKLYQQNEKLQELEKQADNKPEEATASKALYLKAEKKVKSEKLFLEKESSIDLLAAKLKTNRTYLSASINEHTGKNYSTWMNDLRINYAIKLMHEDMAIDTKQLATQCGFTSNDTFYKNFKKRCGVNPSQYLNQIVLEQEAKK